ncbi:MAG: tetratricopeptide repeat protein [Candidatus Cloacimonetes bacterium]|nr:tetratricopeptide repeat protein [Candidatus Cloacimonadota bacterium]
MKKSFIIVLLLILTVMLSADLKEDLRFAIGLYRDNNKQLAKIELKKLLVNYPQSEVDSDIKFLLGNIYLELQEYTNAENYFDELYTSSPHPAINKEVILGFGQSLYFLNKITRAKSVFEEFISIYSGNNLTWKAHYYLGMIDFQQKKYSNAIQNFNKSISIDQQSIVISAMLDLYITMNDSQKINEVAELLQQQPASEIKNKAILILLEYYLTTDQIDQIFALKTVTIPSISAYYEQYKLIIGIALYKNGQLDSAINNLIKIDSQKAEYYLALCYYELDMTEQALEILQKLVNSPDEQISSNSTFYLAKINNDSTLLQKFISENKDNSYVPVAYYILGYNSLMGEDHQSAFSLFNKARETGIKLPSSAYNAVKEKIYYLIPESLYLLNDKTTAKKEYELYLSVFSAGSYFDEANFKIGLIEFENGAFEDAAAYFKIVRDLPGDSDKKGMSNFYLGEINISQGNYSQALDDYETALKGICDIGYTWERISHIYYSQKKYDQARNSLYNIPSEPKYLFDRFLLKGNIEFVERNYDKALTAFSFAADHAAEPLQKEAALSRKAWTLYQLKRYDEASILYSSLAVSADSPEKYIFRAALSAFSSEKYLDAINYFKHYTDNFHNAEDYNSALLGTADSYYNLGDFNNSVVYYKKLITPGVDVTILNNAINGLRWSAEQSNSIDFILEVDGLLRESASKEIRVELLDRKIYYLYKKELWNDAVQTCKELEILDREHKNLNELKLIKALSYGNLKDYQNSVATFEELFEEKHDPAILLHWADLLLKMNNSLEAIDKMRQASMLTRREDIWLRLMEIEQEYKSDYFENDFHKFMEFATGEEKERAQILEVERKIDLKNYSDLDDKIKELNKSKYKSVKADAQYSKGYLLYSQGQYEAAIPELLRLRYLYPEFERSKNKAEALACLSYIKLKNYDEARKLFDVVKNELSEPKRIEIETLLSKRGENE